MVRSYYLIGGSGTGKSTLMARLLEGWAAGPYERLTAREMFGHRLLGPNLELGMYLGRLRPEYPGTDALSLSVAPHALSWLQNIDPQLGWVFGEGAKLAHKSFLEALHQKSALTLVHLELDPAEARARRERRGGKLLSEQYCKIVASKAANTAAWAREAGIHVLSLDASRPVHALAAEILVTP